MPRSESCNVMYEVQLVALLSRVPACAVELILIGYPGVIGSNGIWQRLHTSLLVSQVKIAFA